MERLVILGVSGSIGTQALEVLKEDEDNNFELVGVSVGKNIDRLNEILKEFPSIKYVYCSNREDVCKINGDVKVFCEGEEGFENLILGSKPTLVLNALVGFVGLKPTLICLENGIDVALANKESLVVGGELIQEILKGGKAKLYPVDSEHVAIDKCLKNDNFVASLILTASGGAFRDLSYSELENVTPEDALKHPSWKMGPKITIDCATMMNKGFEIVEAMYLFDQNPNYIHIVLHDESKVHSMVVFSDGTSLAELGPTDMKNPIRYGLYRGHLDFLPLPNCSVDYLTTLHFHKFDEDRYPAINIVYEAIKRGGTSLCALNAANEVLDYAFLDGKIKFTDIDRINRMIVDQSGCNLGGQIPTYEELKRVDKETRILVNKIIEGGM